MMKKLEAGAAKEAASALKETASAAKEVASSKKETASATKEVTQVKAVEKARTLNKALIYAVLAAVSLALAMGMLVFSVLDSRNELIHQRTVNKYLNCRLLEEHAGLLESLCDEFGMKRNPNDPRLKGEKMSPGAWPPMTTPRGGKS